MVVTHNRCRTVCSVGVDSNNFDSQTISDSRAEIQLDGNNELEEILLNRSSEENDTMTNTLIERGRRINFSNIRAKYQKSHEMNSTEPQQSSLQDFEGDGLNNVTGCLNMADVSLQQDRGEIQRFDDRRESMILSGKLKTNYQKNNGSNLEDAKAQQIQRSEVENTQNTATLTQLEQESGSHVTQELSVGLDLSKQETPEAHSKYYAKLFDVIGEDVWSPWGLYFQLPRLNIVVARYCSCQPHLMAMQDRSKFTLTSVPYSNPSIDYGLVQKQFKNVREQLNTRVDEENGIFKTNKVQNGFKTHTIGINIDGCRNIVEDAPGQSTLDQHSSSYEANSIYGAHCNSITKRRWFRGPYKLVLESLADDICLCLNVFACKELKFEWHWIPKKVDHAPGESYEPRNTVESIRRSRIEFSILAINIQSQELKTVLKKIINLSQKDDSKKNYGPPANAVPQSPQCNIDSYNSELENNEFKRVKRHKVELPDGWKIENVGDLVVGCLKNDIDQRWRKNHRKNHKNVSNEMLPSDLLKSDDKNERSDNDSFHETDDREIIVDRLTVRASLASICKASTSLLKFIQHWSHQHHNELVLKGSVLPKLFVSRQIKSPSTRNDDKIDSNKNDRSPEFNHRREDNYEAADADNQAQYKTGMSVLFSPSVLTNNNEKHKIRIDHKVEAMETTIKQFKKKSMDKNGGNLKPPYQTIRMKQPSTFSPHPRCVSYASNLIHSEADSRRGSSKEMLNEMKSEIRSFLQLWLKDRHLGQLLTTINSEIKNGHNGCCTDYGHWIIEDFEFENLLNLLRTNLNENATDQVVDVLTEVWQKRVFGRKAVFQTLRRQLNKNIQDFKLGHELPRLLRAIKNRNVPDNLQVVNHLCMDNIRRLNQSINKFVHNEYESSSNQCSMSNILHYEGYVGSLFDVGLIPQSQIRPTLPCSLALEFQLVDLSSFSLRILRSLLLHRALPEDNPFIVDQINRWHEYIGRIKSLLSLRRSSKCLTDHKTVELYLLSSASCELSQDGMGFKPNSLIFERLNTNEGGVLEKIKINELNTTMLPSLDDFDPLMTSFINRSQNSTAINLKQLKPHSDSFQTTSYLTPQDSSHQYVEHSINPTNTLCEPFQPVVSHHSPHWAYLFPLPPPSKNFQTNMNKGHILEAESFQLPPSMEIENHCASQFKPPSSNQNDQIQKNLQHDQNSSISVLSLPPTASEITKFLKATIERLSSNIITVDCLDRLSTILPKLLEWPRPDFSEICEYNSGCIRSGQPQTREVWQQLIQANRVVIRHVMQIVSTLKSRIIRSNKTALPQFIRSHLTTLKELLSTPTQMTRQPFLPISPEQSHLMQLHQFDTSPTAQNIPTITTRQFKHESLTRPYRSGQDINIWNSHLCEPYTSDCNGHVYKHDFFPLRGTNTIHQQTLKSQTVFDHQSTPTMKSFSHDQGELIIAIPNTNRAGLIEKKMALISAETLIPLQFKKFI